MVRRTKADAWLTRERLLDAAELQFQRQGVSGTTLQDIAQAAGLTRGAIYWHFQDKAELFNAMMNRAASPLAQQILRSGEAGLEDPMGQIRGSFLAALRATVEDPQVRRAVEIAFHKVEYVDETRGVRERRVKGLAERVAQVERGLRRAVRLGQLPPRLPARASALALHALVDGLINHWMLDPQAFDLVRVGRQALDAYLQGLKSPPPPARPRR